jgi:hypothetical protein
MKTLLQNRFHQMITVLREHWQLSLETMALRHQLAVVERSVTRPRFSPVDRCFWIMLSTLWSRWPEALTIVQPDTVRCWRRQGWRYHLQWWHGRQRPGRPAIAAEIRALIRRMSQENVLRSAPRIQGELAKLGLTHHHCEVYGSTARSAVADTAYLPTPSGLRCCCQWGVYGARPPSSRPVRSGDPGALLVAGLLDDDRSAAVCTAGHRIPHTAELYHVCAEHPGSRYCGPCSCPRTESTQAPAARPP